jgi:hypothetical protein
MKKKYTLLYLPLIIIPFLMLTTNSCKKEKTNVVIPPVNATPTKLGLYESDSSIYKVLFMSISQVGTNTTGFDLLFDTGSGGMVLDASGVLSPSMITSSGFNFTGDSTIVDGITITNQTSTIQYGGDSENTDTVYGNLAYASVTVGDQNGNIVIKRLPFFLYYKAVDSKGNKYGAHEFDTFGVSSEYDLSFANNVNIMSPFSYFVPGTGLTSGFKMAALGTSNFSLDGTYASVLTLGLTAADLSSSSGFVMTQLNYEAGDGYAPIIPATVTYNNKAVSTYVIFDTGTEPYTYIEDKTAVDSLTQLPQNVSVQVATGSGFNYSYTTTPTENLTFVENPTTTGGSVSIISLEYFLNNEYMLDYTDHKLGLKNN